MYTRCPACRTTFRVTADVLQQAEGRVRCGGCGQAFNALDGLSEEPPSGQGDSSDRGRRALIDTLDDIPDNIRIEDTGVEWRVMEEDTGTDFLDADDDASDDSVDLTGSRRLRWYIEAGPGDSQNDATVPPGGTEEVREADEPPTARAQPQESLYLKSENESGREEARYDDNTPLPGVLDDDDASPVPEPPRRRAEDFLEPRSPEFDERQVDLALSEPEDWTELLDEVGVGDAAHDRSSDSFPDPDAVAQASPPAIDDTRSDLRGLETDLDPTGEQPVIDAGELSLVDDELPASDTGADADDNRTHTESRDDEWIEAAEEELELELELALDSGDSTGEFEQLEDAGGDDAGSRALDTGSAPQPAEPADPVVDLPPQTEEEMTINRLIDQDLLRLSETGHNLAATGSGIRRPGHTPPHVETIIMEGEFVRTSLGAEEPAADAGDDAAGGETAAVAETTEAAEEALNLRDTYIRARDRVRAGRIKIDATRYAAVAGAAMLALLLAAQVVHAWRESLATWSAFDRTVGSVYRFMGAPITPEWDVNGWQFQTTSGSTDASDQVLTISSRIANRSDMPLPYPLLHVSLTDRYEEIIGSELLEPERYLEIRSAHGILEPGAKFMVSVTIAPLSPEAAGYKLNVCYPLAGEEVRCATGAFKD